MRVRISTQFCNEVLSHNLQTIQPTPLVHEVKATPLLGRLVSVYPPLNPRFSSSPGNGQIGTGTPPPSVINPSMLHAHSIISRKAGRKGGKKAHYRSKFAEMVSLHHDLKKQGQVLY